MELRIILVELKRVTRLAVCSETDSLIKSAARLRFVTVVAVELLPVHRRNVVPEMPLMIEAQDIGIARFVADQLKLRMRVDEGRKHRSVTACRPRHFKNDLLRRMRAQMKNVRRQGRTLLRRCLHDRAV